MWRLLARTLAHNWLHAIPHHHAPNLTWTCISLIPAALPTPRLPTPQVDPTDDALFCCRWHEVDSTEGAWLSRAWRSRNGASG